MGTAAAQSRRTREIVASGPQQSGDRLKIPVIVPKNSALRQSANVRCTIAKCHFQSDAVQRRRFLTKLGLSAFREPHHASTAKTADHGSFHEDERPHAPPHSPK